MRGNLHTQKTFALVVGAMLLPASAIRTQTVTPPPAAPLRPYVFPSVEQFQLPNGLKVILVEKHTLPVVEGRRQSAT